MAERDTRSAGGEEELAPRAGLFRVRRLAEGERLGGFIYGTIVALAVVVAGARAYPDGAGHVAILVALTSGVFWLAHVYADALGHSVAADEHLRLAELRYIARRELSIVEAALPPIVALTLGSIGILSTRASYWLAFALGMVVLFIQGVRFARIERLGLLGTLAVVAGNVGFGIVLIGLKLFASH
jgi:hypothetical protein